MDAASTESAVPPDTVSQDESEAMACPFDPVVHLMSAPISDLANSLIRDLRQSLESESVYHEYRDWCTDAQLNRFCIARNNNFAKTREMILSALKWRKTRIPVDGVESLPGWEARMSKEGETGKIYIPGFDKYDRPVLVFDNTVQNTSVPDDQLAFLAWYLEYACRIMPTGRDKYVVFMHLEAFSFFNCPPLMTIKETIFMVCNAFPERLGHCIAYRAPSIFKTVFNGVKSFIDPKTVSKVMFITGDVSIGSENDLKIKEIIGDNWRELCGAEQPTLKKGNTPGYDHDQHWPMTMQRYQDMIAKEQQLKAETEVTYSLAHAVIAEEYHSQLPAEHFTVEALDSPMSEEVPEEFRAEKVAEVSSAEN
jgi:hypothetical protein